MGALTELLVVVGLLRRVVEEAQIDVRLVREELREVFGGHSEGPCQDRQHALAEPLQGLEVRDHRRPHALVPVRPLVPPAERRARDDVRMVGAAIVADEEALVEVRPGRLVDGRVPLHALVHRQVPDVVLVDLQRALQLERRRVELARGREGVVDHPLRDAVAGQVEEADGLAGAPDLDRHGLQRTRLPSERGPDVDQGDGLRRRVDVLDRQRLEDVHLWASVPSRRDPNAAMGRRPAAFDGLTDA